MDVDFSSILSRVQLQPDKPETCPMEKLRERMLEIPDMRIVTMTGDARRLIVVFEPKPPKPLKLSAGLAPLFGRT
jgi:hypothetical protein